MSENMTEQDLEFVEECLEDYIYYLESDPLFSGLTITTSRKFVNSARNTLDGNRKRIGLPLFSSAILVNTRMIEIYVTITVFVFFSFLVVLETFEWKFLIFAVLWPLPAMIALSEVVLRGLLCCGRHYD